MISLVFSAAVRPAGQGLAGRAKATCCVCWGKPSEAPLAARPLRLVRLASTEEKGSREVSQGSEEPVEKELETWQKSWVRQNPGRPLSEMPAEEPKFNPDNFDPLSIATGGVSLLALAGALWVANTVAELRDLSPEELNARFGDDPDFPAPAPPSASSAMPSAPSLTD